MRKFLLRNAREHLEKAERALNAGLDEVACEKAVYSGECALKAVLVKNGVFSRDDWKHDQRITLSKIKRLGLLNSSVLAQVEDIVTDRDGVEGLTWIDLEQDTTHMDCPHIQRTRYPFEKYSSYDMLKSGDARALLRRKTSIDVAVLSVNATLPG